MSIKYEVKKYKIATTKNLYLEDTNYIICEFSKILNVEIFPRVNLLSLTINKTSLSLC